MIKYIALVALALVLVACDGNTTTPVTSGTPVVSPTLPAPSPTSPIPPVASPTVPAPSPTSPIPPVVSPTLPAPSPTSPIPPVVSPTLPAPSPTSPIPPGQCRIRGVLPDPNCTPGVLNLAVTQSTINTTICVAGWTKTIRPPASYTDNLKTQQIAQYGYADITPADYEEDHLISLELGGNPTDPQNLWPEPRTGSPNATNKDKVENYVKAQVCSGKLSLADAQKGIATDWTQYLSTVAVSVEDISSDDPDDNGE